MRKELQDLDPMPFGKYKGTPMQDVPASYLHWFWTKGSIFDAGTPVRKYIIANMSLLKIEHPDGIWE